MSIGFWTDARIEEFKVLWTTDQSASQIGAALGCSRCAVLGKRRRLDLPQRPRTPGHRKPRERVQAKAPILPSQAEIAAIEPPQPVEGGVPVIDLEAYHCRAVVGTGPDGMARFCGAQKEPPFRSYDRTIESAYCSTHGAQYYQRDR